MIYAKRISSITLTTPVLLFCLLICMHGATIVFIILNILMILCCLCVERILFANVLQGILVIIDTNNMSNLRTSLCSLYECAQWWASLSNI